MGPTTPSCKHDGLGCSAFARRYWRNHYCFLFLWVLRWFTSPRCLPPAYVFSGGCFGINRSGFPHSEIPGSMGASPCPGLIAGSHVLHRRLAPRHPPYALSSLTIKSAQHTKSSRQSIVENRGVKTRLRLRPSTTSPADSPFSLRPDPIPSGVQSPALSLPSLDSGK